jgi:hypothetical protein
MPSFPGLELLMPEGTCRSHKFSLWNRLSACDFLRMLALEND